MDNTLEKCLEFMNIKKLPKESREEFDTRAILQVVKVGNTKAYCIGVRQNGMFRILKDFDKKGMGVMKVIAAYPVVEKSIEKKIDVKTMNLKELKELLDKENILFQHTWKKEELIEAYERAHYDD